MEKQIRCKTELFPTISATIYGSGNPVNILLLHGFPADSSLWRSLIPLLADKYCLIVPDLPGVGESTFVGDELSMEAVASAMITLLDELKVEQAIVAGHSMGGYIAMAIAALYGSRLAGIAMIHSGATADNEEKVASRQKAITLIEKGGKKAFVEAMIPSLFAEDFRSQHPEVVNAQREQALQVEELSLVSFYKAMIKRPDRLDVLRSAPFPIQWVLGAEDTLAAPSKIMQQTRLGNVNFVVIYKNSSHMAMLECPVQLANDLGHFTDYCTAQLTAHLPA